MIKLAILTFCLVLITACGGSNNSSPSEAPEPFADFEPIFQDNDLTELELNALILALDTTDAAFVNRNDLAPIMDELLVIRATAPNTQLISARSNNLYGFFIRLSGSLIEGQEPWADLPLALQPLQVTTRSTQNFFLLETAINLNPALVLESYSELAQVERVEFNGLVGDGDDICREQDQTSIYYVFRQGEGDCPSGCINETYYGFALNQMNQVTALGIYEGGPGQRDSEPDWLVDRLECRSAFPFSL